MVKIGNRNYKVFKKIPKNIEDKLLAHREEILKLGSDYVPPNLDKAREPINFILASLCVDAPYNQIEFWQKYDKASGWDSDSLLDLIINHIKSARQ